MPPSSDPASTPFTYAYDPALAKLPRPYQGELIGALCERLPSATPGARLLVEVATGGGKSLIANDFAWTCAAVYGLRILRVTMNWELTAQGASDLCTRWNGARDAVSYVGDGVDRVMNGLTNSPDGQIIFSTIQTWNARKDTEFAGQTFDVVMVDEVHWGEGAKLYETLRTRHPSAVFVGFTATPRRWSDYERVGHAYDLRSLVQMGYLAEPRLEVIRTGVDWRPRMAGEHGDVTPGSLRHLATSEQRNKLIVSTYLARASEYGKTIAFACNIAHADVLTGMLVDQGVRAAALHSRMKGADRSRVIDAFRGDGLDVLVNVGIAVHGLDVPDIKTVMLARPTASDILMQQMIGRGVRLAPGKEFFHLVDFVDNAAVHGGVPLVRPDGFIGSRLGPGARGEVIPQHAYVLSGLEPFPAVEGYETLRGLPVQPQQTFGIEFELTSVGFDVGGPSSAQWTSISLKILETLRLANLTTSRTISRGHGPRKDNTVWNVEYDASCGWEITSRILRGFEGFIEIMDACNVIGRLAAELGLNVTIRTGTHVHLGWTGDALKLRRLFEVAAYFEPALLSLVAPSRANSHFAASVRRMLKQVRGFTTVDEWTTFLRPHWRRYLAVNPRGLFYGYGTVEIRMHSGTIEGPKILTWLSLWMAIFAAAEEGRPLPGNPEKRLYRAPLCPGPRGDVVVLAEYVGGGEALTNRLVARRAYVVSNSWTQRGTLRCQELARRLLSTWHRQNLAHPEQAADAAAE